MASAQKNGTAGMLELKVVRPTATEAIIKWTSVPDASIFMLLVKDPLVLQSEWMFNCGPELKEFKMPVSLQPGHTYHVTLRAQKVAYRDTTVFYKTLRQANISFRAELTKDELAGLLERARTFVTRDRNQEFDKIQWLYRNKPASYFDHIQQNTNGVMEVYLKDQNGDPGSVINGKLNGLFFATNVDRRTLQPPMQSHFGDTRLYLPAAQVFAPDSTCLYFADFYCNFAAHYVTLVLTNLDSEADRFCRENLIELNTYNNDFFYKQLPDMILVTRNVHVEVLYTENVDIPMWISQHGAVMGTVEISKGTSTPGGLPKNARCSVCNVHPKEIIREEMN